MGYLFLVLLVIVFVMNMFSGGGSARSLRQIFFGWYFAEDGVTGADDVPNAKETFEKCIENEIGIKVNVHCTDDKRAVISTYNDLSREYGVDKKVSECTADELEELGIMGLNEFVEMVGTKVPVILQLVPGEHNESLCRYTADVINSSGNKNIAVTSFHTGMINWFKQNEKKVFRGLTSAPAKDFTSLSPMERFLTGNMVYNSVSRPQFIMYRNKKQSIFVKLAFAIGAIKGVWTITDKAEGERQEETKDMIVIRGFMPEKGQFKVLPDRVKSQIEIDVERKEAEKAARKKAKQEFVAQREKEKKGGIDKAFLEAAEDFTEEITEFVDEVKEEVAEIIEEIRD